MVVVSNGDDRVCVDEVVCRRLGLWWIRVRAGVHVVQCWINRLVQACMASGLRCTQKFYQAC